MLPSVFSKSVLSFAHPAAANMIELQSMLIHICFVWYWGMLCFVAGQMSGWLDPQDWRLSTDRLHHSDRSRKCPGPASGRFWCNNTNLCHVRFLESETRAGHVQLCYLIALKSVRPGRPSCAMAAVVPLNLNRVGLQEPQGVWRDLLLV